MKKFETAKKFLQEAGVGKLINNERSLELLEKFLTQPESLPEGWDSRLPNFNEEDQKIGELTEEEKRFLFNVLDHRYDLAEARFFFFALEVILLTHIKTKLGKTKGEIVDICKGGIIIKPENDQED